LSIRRKNLYSLDFLAARPDPGAYVLEFRVIPQEKQNEYQAITSTLRRVQVVAAVGLTDGFVLVSDHATERDLQGKAISFEQAKTIKQTLDIKGHQHIYITFKLKNVVSSRSVLAHQTFVKISNTKTKDSAYFVIPHSAQTYDLRLSVAKLASKFNNATNGTYEIELMIGDSFISSSFRWVLAKATILFDPKSIVITPLEDPFTPRTLIEHKFRPAASTAPEYMSNIFVVLVILPIGILVVGILRAGGNLKNFPRGGLISIYGILFVVGLGFMLGLIVCYWYHLKLFTAIGYELTIGVPTLFFGNQVLYYYAQQREPVKKQKTQ